LALLNSGFIREKEVDMWRAAAGDPYPMEKAEDEIPIFARFVERGLALPASDFFKGLLGYYGVEYLNLNPNGHELHFLQGLGEKDVEPASTVDEHLVHTTVGFIEEKPRNLPRPSKYV
jgi:hypothetical protein